MSVSFWVKGLEGIKTPHAFDHPDHLAYGICDEPLYCYDWVETGFNCSNSNARVVLSALGLAEDDEWYSGQIAPSDLKGRALVALGTVDDNGWKDTVTVQEGSATFIDCGVPAGYLGERWNWLLELADQAETLGSVVVWG